jgi:SHS2 domain-containing protein
MAPPADASHVLVDHTGEVELRLRAPTLSALFVEAGRAVAELMLGEDREPAPGAPVESVVVQAPDRDALLVAWIDELVYRADTRKTVFTRFAITHITATELAADLRGVPEPTLKTAIKAATYHRLSITDHDGGVTATVVLDV